MSSSIDAMYKLGVCQTKKKKTATQQQQQNTAFFDGMSIAFQSERRFLMENGGGF